MIILPPLEFDVVKNQAGANAFMQVGRVTDCNYA